MPFRPLPLALGLLVASVAPAAEPPTSWIDPDTGHRVVRLTQEPGSDSFYFNVNGYTPDGKEMVYSTPDGISVLNLATREARQVVKGKVRAVEVGRKTPSIYYTKAGAAADAYHLELWRANVDTGAAEKLADLPRRAGVNAINADETLAAGTYIEGDAAANGSYDGTPRAAAGRMSATNLGEPLNKGQMMERRLAAKLPMTLYTLELGSGKIHPLIEHSTDWLNHVQFSPTDPTLCLYCHEGPWWKVDRIWMIRTDGSGNRLVHQRTMEREIAGHEWWSTDGSTIWYQLHFYYGTSAPSFARISYVAGYQVTTGKRTWYRYDNDATSIHDSSSPDGKLFCGDGGTKTPWIFLLTPKPVLNHEDTFGKNLIGGGYLESEKLVNLSKHNYRLEPNPSFTPDMKWIVFRSNMFGPDYAFAVELAK